MHAPRILSGAAGAALLFLTAGVCPGADPSPRPAAPPAWLSRVDPLPDPASLTPPRPFKASYRIAWAGIAAAKAEIECTLPPDSTEVRTRLKTSTMGLARTMWQMDAVHLAIADRRTIRPIRIEETDKRETKEIVTRVEFPPDAAVRYTHTVYQDDPTPANEPKVKPKRFEYPNLLDMHSALLDLRNVSLAPGERHVALVMTVTNPYLVTVKALGRETVEVKAGRKAAIRCSITLGKIDKNGNLQPAARFKSATAWISDDADRTLLKVEAKVFVGTVVLELEHLNFTDALGH